MTAVAPLKVLFVSAEAAPWCGTGGLGDVVGALPDALVSAGATPVEVAVVCPLYRDVRRRAAARGARFQHVTDLPAGPGAIPATRVVRVEGASTNVQFCFVDCPPLYDREGLYDDPRGWTHGDNVERFATLCFAALAASPGLLGGAPDVVHAHDWHAALAIAYARRQLAADFAAAATVLTIHNGGYQGEFDPAVAPRVGLEWGDVVFSRFEHFGRLNLLKGGIALADAITTVSPTHAQELQRDELGHGLAPHMRFHSARLSGIVNGIDTHAWDPAHDPAIAARYDRPDAAGKRECRAALANELGLDVEDQTPVIGVVARLAEQKGLDVLADAIGAAVDRGARVALLGAGDPWLAARWRALAAASPGRIAVRIGFDLGLAHRIEAGADMFAMPSRYEPCGLNQLYSMRYGTVPIVHGVGGLADTVVDEGEGAHATGFVFRPLGVETLGAALARALDVYRDRPARWLELAANGMARDSSWAPGASAYLDVYATARARARTLPAQPLAG
ncbi:MAG: glycogen synthase GlgA [Myxococcales bacterium]|nr:glycogen synthase GlgA [Myxococcales bacterium]MCB9531437.1 glycogen synthase GlgA [Myxococcales bacterium]MCB9534052.1 glycogen synthase GlgA [Myxococcales bacterium]